ncbi:MAG: Gfo/Idh/MocA family oxidoreductase [Actinomycetota bacterium]|nr:Gfo/Idh/MocA family oxidoreductase [Actinomycetota bacterium]
MRVLILAGRPSVPGAGDLGPLATPDWELTVAWSGEALPDPAGFDAVVVDDVGSPRPLEDLERLAASVEAGRPLVALGVDIDGGDGFWTELLGVHSGDRVNDAEYFGRVVGGAELVSRVEREFAFVDGFCPLISQVGTQTIVSASIGFRDHALVTATRRGAGRVVACAVARPSAAPLVTILRRALAPASTVVSPLGIAIVGYGPFGGMGYYHGLGITGTDGLELVAVVDSSDQRRKAAGDDFPGLTTYASVDDLASDDAVDVAIVATPPSAHFGLTRQQLQAGKHVACEKPLCLTAGEADELIATARSHQRVLTVHQNRRWDPDFLAVRRAIDAGLLGDLFNVETFVGGFEHPCRAWHSDVEVSGGAVYDWGSHHVDWILQLLGSAPSRVTTFGHKRVWHDVTNLDQLRLHLAWNDGREAEFFQSDVAGVRRPKFFVQGTAGTLVGNYRPLTFERIEPGRGYVAEQPHHAEAPADLTLARYESGYGLTSTSLPVAPEQHYAFHRNLADHLHLGEPLAVTPESVRSVVAVLEASQKSSDEGGRVIELPTP